MKPTQILSNEHRVIELVLDCLEQVVKEAISERKLDKQAASQVVDFVRNFADQCHHGKEETYLFVSMVEKGMPKESGPVGQMLTEHEQGRMYVRGMEQNIEKAAHGEADALTSFESNARGYIQLLRAHIRKEDGVLFPMADRLLSDDDQNDLLNNFNTVEAEHMGEGTHEKYLRLAESLADRYGLSKDALTAQSCTCGH